MPILLYENYDDDNNLATVYYHAEETHAAGDVVQVLSNNEFPFDYTLTAPMVAGDSVEIHDPISAKMYVAFTDALYVTLTPLMFNVEAVWYKLADRAHGFQGEPLSMAISADGDNMFVGMKNGRLFRISGLNSVVDEASGTITDTVSFFVNTTEIMLPTEGQCVTSIAFNPKDANKVIVTCGNYGNNDYVFYSTDALAAVPTFTSKQANLAKMPVYSSLIEMETGDVILGTERGIYRTDNINNPTWNADTHMLGEVPVMDLKQQLLYHEDEVTVNETEEGTFITNYPGVYNTGVIYAATYGRGVFRCENYKREFYSVPDAPKAEVNVAIYPNPVSTQATVSFELGESSNVSYQVFDINGRMVMNQNLGRMAEGAHQINVNTENLSTGSYILRLNQGSTNACVKFMVF